MLTFVLVIGKDVSLAEEDVLRSGRQFWLLKLWLLADVRISHLLALGRLQEYFNVFHTSTIICLFLNDSEVGVTEFSGVRFATLFNHLLKLPLDLREIWCGH